MASFPQAVTTKQPLKGLLKEWIGFELFLGLILFGPVIVFYVLNGYSLNNYRFWFTVFWYPLAFLAAVLWISVIHKYPFRRILLYCPQWPDQGHRWFYIVVLVLIPVCLVSIIILWNMLGVVFDEDPVVFGFAVVHSCIGAPIVEEIIFRGYFYQRSEEVFGQGRWFAEIRKESDAARSNSQLLKKVGTFEITYAAIFSSMIFGIWHLNPIQAIYTFFAGLIFCKARNDWKGTLVIPMILHMFGNLFSILVELMLDKLLAFVVSII